MQPSITHNSIENSGETPLFLEDLLQTIAFLANQGWTPATSSNFSIRDPLDSETFWISASGKDKRLLQDTDFLKLPLKHWAQNFVKNSTQSLKPSAETLLHDTLYQWDSNIGCVLHTHSTTATVISKLWQLEKAQRTELSPTLIFQDYEILKGLKGIQTHETSATLPLFMNHQDMTKIVTALKPVLTEAPSPLFGFLVVGHGLYAWGETVAEAQRHLETYEYLLTCQLELSRHGHRLFS